MRSRATRAQGHCHRGPDTRASPCASSANELAPPTRIMLFPFTPVGVRNLHGIHRALIQTARIDAESVRVRARHVEGFDAAHRTEQMPCGCGVELILAQRLRTLHQAKA